MLVQNHHELDPTRFIPATPRTEEGYASFLGSQLGRRDTVLLVAEREGVVVGYAWGAFEGTDYMALRGPAGVLHDLVVDPAHRRQGLGRMLLEASVEALRALGAPRIVLSTAARNDIAQRLFTAAGVPAYDARADARSDRLGPSGKALLFEGGRRISGPAPRPANQENAMPGHHHPPDHPDGHDHDNHGHRHGGVDPSVLSHERGLWAVKWSFLGLFITAALQLVVVLLSHSVALLADTIHNFGDAATGVPLGIAFLFARRPPDRRFHYGYGRVEDLAGLAVVLTILFSAGVAAHEAVERLLHPQPVSHLGAVAIASIIGFLGNELVAVFRIRVGKEIRSAALIADGYHARTDGWTSLAVLVGAVGVYLGYPKADPVIGLVITAAILGIVWQSGKTVLVRTLDGVEPEVLDQVRHAAEHVPGVLGTSDLRARWVGHRLRVEANVAVEPELTVAEGHQIAKQVEHELRDHLKFVSGVIVHVDPAEESGELHHRFTTEAQRPQR